jgi:hypothetical protein
MEGEVMEGEVMEGDKIGVSHVMHDFVVPLYLNAILYI